MVQTQIVPPEELLFGQDTEWEESEQEKKIEVQTKRNFTSKILLSDTYLFI